MLTAWHVPLGALFFGGFCVGRGVHVGHLCIGSQPWGLLVGVAFGRGELRGLL